jgi:tRNA dimethylallyltransferase
MYIGTAVPSDLELSEVKHHFIQNISIHTEYNVGQFERDSMELLQELFKKHQIVVMVGGSGLYVDAVLKGLDNFPDVNPEIRENLKKELGLFGISHLQDQLKKLDPVTYEKIDLENHQRVIRALEICIGTGKPYASFLTEATAKRNFTPIKIGLTADRQIIYDRINQRVDIMMEEGLLEEVKKLTPFKNLNALQTVGYKELFLYLNNEIPIETAIEEIKKNTRRFAKRQLTWYRKDDEIKWFDYQEDVTKIINCISEKL